MLMNHRVADLISFQADCLLNGSLNFRQVHRALSEIMNIHRFSNLLLHLAAQVTEFQSDDEMTLSPVATIRQLIKYRCYFRSVVQLAVFIVMCSNKSCSAICYK